MFCPSCGNESFQETGSQRYQCGQCGFTFYRNAAAAVAVVIRCKGEVLFAVRAREPGKGMLDLPGGFVDLGETLEETVRREVFEELRLEVSTPRYVFSEPNVYRYKEVDYNTLDAFFDVSLQEKPAVVPGDDVADVVWRTLASVDPDEIALPSIKRGLQRLLRVNTPSS